MLLLGNKEPKLNVPKELIIENVEHAIRLGLPQVQPHLEQDTKVIIAAGGPSLAENIDEIREKRADGYKLVSVNATHDFLISHGIMPSAHVQLDARPFNERFLRNPQKGIKYLMASQCPQEAFDNLEGFDVLLWHAVCSPEEEQILNNYYFGQYFPIIGGSTVVLRALQLMRLLGFKWFELYGFDSCVAQNKAHSYTQPENDADQIMTIRLEGREFQVTPSHFSQIREFIDIVKHIGDQFNMVVHGDGAIAHLIKSAANKRAA